MRIPQTYLQSIKLALHGAQAICIFIGGCLALAVLIKDGETGAQVSYYFGLCFLTILALAYQVIVPMWSRAWRFANIYACASIDILFNILWLAAFASVATWQADGISKGSKKDDGNTDRGGCSNFAFGSEAKCETSRAAVGFGVVICLLFAATSAISVHNVLQYRKTGIMPNGSSARHDKAEQMVVDDPGKDVWSANTDELDLNHHPNWHSENDDPRRAYGQLPREGDVQSHLLQRPSSNEDPFLDTHSTEGGAHPGRPLSFSSSTSLSIAPPPSHRTDAPTVNITSPTGYVAPSALSPSDYEETPGGRVSFPRGNYGADLSYR